MLNMIDFCSNNMIDVSMSQWRDCGRYAGRNYCRPDESIGAPLPVPLREFH